MARFEWLFGERYGHDGFPVSPFVPGFDESTARERHAAGELYCAVLRDTVKDYAVASIELMPGEPFASVIVYDEWQRILVRSGFVAVVERPGVLFLKGSTVVNWERVTAEGKPCENDMFSFRADGWVLHRHLDVERGVKTEREGTREAWALEMNYEPVPAFGDYASLLRVERDLPVSEQPEGSASRIVADGLVG